MKMNIIGLIIFIVVCGCKKSFEDEQMTLKKQTYSSNQLKIDGYYYLQDLITKKIVVKIFYRNGIVIYGGTGMDQNWFEDAFRSGEFYNWIRDNHNCWGLFEIDNNMIKTEHLFNQNTLHLYSYVTLGKLLNDSTIVFTKSIRSTGSIEKILHDTMHFRKFSPKPDSTNNFVK